MAQGDAPGYRALARPPAPRPRGKPRTIRCRVADETNGVVVSLPPRVPVSLATNRTAPKRIERRGVHRIPPRRP